MDPEQREIDASLPTQAVEITPPTEQPDLNPDTVTPQELADPITRRRFLDVLKDAAYPFFIGGNLSNSFPQGKLFRGAIENMLHTGEPAIPVEQLIRTYNPGTEIEVHGKSIQHIGVAHSPESYQANKNDMRKRIHNAPGVIFMEYFDDRVINQAVPSHPEPTSRTDFTNVRSQTGAYFAALGRLAALEGKDIIVVNPDNSAVQASDIPIMGATAALFAHDYGRLKQAKDVNSTITRRSFLGKLARTGARAAAYTVGGPMLLRQATGIDIPSRLHRAMQTQGVLTDDLTPEEQAKILEWGAIDYRNVCTAIGVEAALTKYQSEIPEDKIIPIFEGDNHSDTMNYLVDPALRQKKNLAYAPMNLLGNRTVRRFHFDSESESWSLVDSFNY